MIYMYINIQKLKPCYLDIIVSYHVMLLMSTNWELSYSDS
jgi:hypothetical protein